MPVGISEYSSHFSHGIRKPENYSPSAARFWRDFFKAMFLRKWMSILQMCALVRSASSELLHWFLQTPLCCLAVFLKLRRLRWLKIVSILSHSQKIQILRPNSWKMTPCQWHGVIFQLLVRSICILFPSPIVLRVYTGSIERVQTQLAAYIYRFLKSVVERKK